MTPFRGRVWRILPRGADPGRPATHPEGRFHHSGQSALYASLTPEGCAVAIRRYLGPEDPPRVLAPLTLQIDRVLDLRGRADLSVIWQDQRAAGKPSPTWAFSDAARLKGAQAMLYSSRSRPELSHLVLFDAPELPIRSIGPVVDADAFLHPPG